MREALVNYIDPVTRSAAGALLCSVLTEYLSIRESELCSEILCWVSLPIFFIITKQAELNKFSKLTSFGIIPETQPVSALSLWIVTLGIVILCSFKAEIGLVGFLVSTLFRKSELVEKLTLCSRKLTISQASVDSFAFGGSGLPWI